MAGSDLDDDEQQAGRPKYAGLPIANRRAVWLWRIRLFLAGAPVAWLMAGDLPAFLVLALGAILAMAVWVVGSRLATLEIRARIIRSLRVRG